MELVIRYYHLHCRHALGEIHNVEVYGLTCDGLRCSFSF